MCWKTALLCLMSCLVWILNLLTTSANDFKGARISYSWLKAIYEERLTKALQLHKQKKGRRLREIDTRLCVRAHLLYLV